VGYEEMNLNVGCRKLHNLVSNPIGVYYRYKGKLKTELVKLMGRIPPIQSEDYGRHLELRVIQE
jgi:hypothetical protein